MSEGRHIPEPGEAIHTPRPSWGPAWFAVGAIGLVCGIYAADFIFAPYVYAVVGAIIALAALRSMIRGAVRDFYRLPRRQRARGAALPVETVEIPKP